MDNNLPAYFSILLLILLTGVVSSDKRSPAFGYEGRIDEHQGQDGGNICNNSSFYNYYCSVEICKPNPTSEQCPAYWSENYRTCSGKLQSPIDIEEHLVNVVELPPLEFHGFKLPPVTSTLSNNGHTVKLELNTSEEAAVSGGPLNGRYLFAQLHFHWGHNDSVGSEDTINNHTFPLELHLVFYKQDYGSVEKSLDHSDGLAVLAVFFEVHGDDNKIYTELVRHVTHVKSPGDQVRLRNPVTLHSLLPATRHLYFTYNGSLTTPPCSEVVTWIDFKTPILLSHRQVEAFRMLHSHDGFLTHNFRPVQPLGERLVHFNVRDKITSGQQSTFYFMSYCVLIVIIILSLKNIS